MIHQFQKAETIFIPPNENKTEFLDEFILNNFQISDNNLNAILSFIDEDLDLKNLIYDLPNVIKKEFPNDKIGIEFYEDEFEKNNMIQINIFSSLDGDVSFSKENKIYDILLEKFNLKTVDKIFLNMVYLND